MSRHITTVGITVPVIAADKPSVNLPPPGYLPWLDEIKGRVRTTQFTAARAANAEVINLYWSIGCDILERQERFGWGAQVVKQLANDLRSEFPDQTGWSPRNLHYMRALAQAWRDHPEFVPQVVAQMPWGHVRTLIDKLKTLPDKEWYASRAVTEGWSRAVLTLQIDTNLKERTGAAPSNFAATLTASDSELAQALIKDPYLFQHVALTAPLVEHDVEDALTNRIQDTLMELGRGMTFVGRQVRFTIDGVDRNVDLIFFHVEQLRYIVVELKVRDFEPDFVGQLGMYVAIVDDVLRKPAIHAPTVGLLLCTGKREATVRYALASSAAPMAVARWQGLPEDVRAALPSAEELQAVIQDEMARQGTNTAV